MTLAAPRSRQGKAFLVLAIFAAVTAVLGTFFWANQAHADLPTTTLTFTQSPAGPATVPAGTPVTYTVTLTTTGTNSSGNVVLTVTVDPDFAWSSASCSTPAGGVVWSVNASTPTFTCTSTGATTNINPETMTVSGTVKGDVSPPTVTVHDGAGATINGVGDGSVGLLTLGAGATVADATNPPGAAHTFVFNLLAGWTCGGDTTDNQARDCVAGDVTVGGSEPCTASAPVVTGSDPVNPGTVSVTLTPTTGVAGTCTATLAIKFIGPVEDNTSDDCCPQTVTATKTFAIAAGSLCHLDLPDAATENAAGNTNGILYIGNTLANGCRQSDIDDATGSFHAACLEGSSLTFATNNAQITWTITAVNGGPVAQSQTSFAGPTGEPCVMWSAGGVGTQDITATYSNGLFSETFFWNGNCSAGVCTLTPGTGAQQPLIKEWNTIDFTRIISATGDVGQNLVAAAAVTGLTATGGTTTTIVDADATFQPGALVGRTVTFTGGAGIGQSSVITANTTTQITFAPAVVIPADATTVYSVGAVLTGNTGELANWVFRDCSFTPAIDPGNFCARANLNGTTKDISGALDPNGNVSANGASFIDYTMGHHNDAGGAYSGPVDGAQQIYCNGTLTVPVTGPATCSASGSDCGTVRVEDPTTGVAHILQPGQMVTVNSSDKGVGFQVLPSNTGNLNCQPDSCVTVTIDTREAGLFHSPPLVSASLETITVCFHVGPPTNKQPLLAWAGQRIVLEHDWSFTDNTTDPPTRTCPFNGLNGFDVRYVKESGNGALISDLGAGAASGPDFMVVHVDSSTESSNTTDPNSNCISRVIYESQDQGEQDVVAHVVQCAPVFFPGTTQVDGQVPSIDPDTCRVVSQQVAFLAFYMKFEDVTLKLLPDSTTHGATTSQSSSACDTTGQFAKGTTTVATGCSGSTVDGAASTTANVSANVLARATVRGWVLADNCPARDSSVGSNGEFIPANRCIFPDDWLFKAGGAAALQTRPNYDIYGGSAAASCPNVAGPFSQLDGPLCGDSQAPHAGGGQRETNFPDGKINADDAPMPSALIRFGLTGSGFLLGAAKHNANNQFDVTHIPAEPWIAPTNADGSGYQWNSWGTGPKSGVYPYWTEFAKGPQVLSCAGKSSVPAFVFVPGVTPDPCGDGSGVPTGGSDVASVYSDEHGDAMTWINGDANLAFTDCSTAAPVSGTTTPIVLLKGFFCKSGDTVGTSTLNALADYPDKRKHFAVESGNVTVTWTWGGIKDVTVVPDPADATGQFHYVVLHVTDRDGFCGALNANGSELHPVLGEEVDFRVDSTTGFIVPDINGNSAEGPAVTVAADGKSATTHTFDTTANPAITIGAPAADECQAWIHISESLLSRVNVVVTAFDPEGTVTFDTIINPTPTPSPVPTPVPTASPFTLHLKWGDSDCSGTVAPRDGQAILLHFLDQTELSQTQPCPTMGETVMIDGNVQHWGDFDCSGAVAPRDGQAVLFFFLNKTALSNTPPCPAIGDAVDVQLTQP